jgi:colicin import membrane protein
MKRGFFISLSVHLGLLAIIFGPLMGRATVLSPGTIYEVSLVSLPAGFPGPPPGNDESPDATLATPEPGEPSKEALKLPAEKKASQKEITPEKKKDSSEKKKNSSQSVKTGKKSSDASKSDLHSLVKGGSGSGGSSGPGGFSSQLQLDIENFEFSYYLVAVRNKVSSNWSPPAGLSTSASAVRTVIFFRIQRDGKIADLKIETPSSIGFFDQSALRAVLRSEPFPSLPRGFVDGSLGVHFGFEYVR